MGSKGLHTKPVGDLLVCLSIGTKTTINKVLVTNLVRFSEVSDAQHSLMLLRNVHKKPEELVQVYSETFNTSG